MVKILKAVLGQVARVKPVQRTSIANLKRANHTGDFRAVEIAPCLMCCKAAIQATGRLYLLREAPRLPLMGCTLPTNCSCKFRKNSDRRDSDRRLFGATETNRWFAGHESRQNAGRRSAET